MSNKKEWWKMFQESLELPKVKEFMNTMNELGASGGPQVNCFVYHKNGIVLVANYRYADGEIIGAIMTSYVYDNMMLDRREETNSLPCGYFAWTYKYGFDYLSSGWNAVNAFKYAINQGPTAAMNTLGACYHDVMYLVREYVDSKPKGEYGVHDDFNLVGIFEDIHVAEDAAEEVLKETGSWNDHDVAIIPVIMNHKYATRPQLGGSCYIE